MTFRALFKERHLMSHSILHRISFLLYPASQLVMVAVSAVWIVRLQLPEVDLWVVGLLALACIPVDFQLFREVRKTQEADILRERVRMLEEQERVQVAYREQIAADMEDIMKLRRELLILRGYYDEIMDVGKALEENENRREGLTVQKRMLMAAQGSDSSAPEPSESAGGSYAASMQAKALASGASAPALLRLERGIQFCEEAAQLVLLVEREFDLIEKKYNRLIELKTVFARRALARIHYLLQEGAGVEDSTLELIGLLNHGDKKEALLEELRDSMYVTAPFSIVGDASLYNRRPRLENQFVPLALQEEASSEIADFVPKPLYTGRQLEEFRRRHTKNGVFQVLEDTVQSAEDLEKLLFI